MEAGELATDPAADLVEADRRLLYTHPMIDYFAYPLGDLQTWMSYSSDWHSLGRAYLGLKLGSFSLAKKFLDAGIRPRGRPGDFLGYIDTVTGLPFLQGKNGFRLDIRAMHSPEHDIVDTRYFRQQLAGTLKLPGLIQTSLMTGGAIDRYVGALGSEATEFLSAPIVELEASTFEECQVIIDEIHNNLSSGPYFRRLWLRGQRQGYALQRDEEVCRVLGYGGDGERQPSLVPSLGRFAMKNPGAVNPGYVFIGPSHAWKKPFLIWVIRQNPEWLSHYPEFRERVESSLRDSDDEVFTKILVDIQMDPRVPTEVDDLRQWFFAFYKYSIWIWVLQQYGYLASMLDLTWDLDTALFFSQAAMVDGRFQLPQVQEGRVIYIFAESKESGSFFDIDRVSWGDDDWNRTPPPRIEAQRCGCLVGSTDQRQNLYGNLVVARIHIRGSNCLTRRSVEDVFPGPDKDLLYKTLSEANPRPEGLY